MVKKVGSKRNGMKYECPAFIYKPIPKENQPLDSLQDLYLDSYFLSTVESDRIWMERNVVIVLECPRFDSI